MTIPQWCFKPEYTVSLNGMANEKQVKPFANQNTKQQVNIRATFKYNPTL